MTSPGFYICVSSEVKTDVFDIWEYFLVYGLVQSSYSRSVLPLLAPVPPCLISDLFTQILLVVTFSRLKRSWLKITIFRKSRKENTRSVSFDPNEVNKCQNENETDICNLDEIRHLSSASEVIIIIFSSSLCFWRLASSVKSWVLGLGLARTTTTTTKETRK